MDQPISQHLPLLGYNLPSEHDYDLSPAAHHSTYAAGGAADGLRRDGSLAQSSDLISPSNGIRCAPQRATAHDSEYLGLSDSGTGSISTSPSSSASSIAYPSSSTTAVYAPSNTAIGLTANSYPTASHVFTATQYPFSQTYNSMSNARPRLASIGDTTSGILNAAARPSVLGNPISPTSTTTIRDQYATSTPGLSRHLVSPRAPFDSISRTYNGYPPDTPRTMMSTASMSLSPSYGSAAAIAYREADNRGTDSLPFLDQEMANEISCNGSTIRPNIEAKMEKGFFLSGDGHWTCYRRNYFSVLCSYALNPHPAGQQLHLIESGHKQPQPIQAFGLCLSAAVDNGGGKSIELVQHTPKRDKGPQNPVQITKLHPTPPGPKHNYPPSGYPINTFDQSAAHQVQPPPYLPLQDARDTSQDTAAQSAYAQNTPAPTAHQHTFERIQFKSATANNGKRRAQQQYYHLIVELWADVRNINDKDPKWKKVAQRVSHQVVVRGRSPSHYSNEGPHSASTRGGPGGASGTGSGSLSMTGGLGAAGVGYGRSYGNGMSYGSGYRGQTYRGSLYSIDPTPIGSTSMTIAGSNDGIPVDALAEHKSMMMHSSGDEDDIKGYETNDAYQYIPGPLYDHANTQAAKAEVYEPIPIKHEATTSVFPPGGVASAFRGVDTSRGLYSTVATGY